MPSTNVRRGIYWSDTSRTWHYEFKFGGKKYNGDTGHVLEKDAIDWVARKKAQIKKVEVGLLAAEPAPTLGEALDQWLEEWGPRVGHRHKTITRDNIRMHLAGHLKTPLPLLTTTVINKAVGDYLAKEDHSAGGANVMLRSLKVVVRYALKARRIEIMPYEVPLLDVQEKPRHAMTAEEVGRLVATLTELKAPIQAIDQTYLMAGLGLRVSESCLARVEAVDLRRREFTPWDPVVGTKGGEAEALPIPAWVMPHVLRMVGDRTEGYLVQGARNDAPSRQVAWKWIDRASAKLRWRWLTPHELRAAYATMLQEEGMNAKAIQALLRHKDFRTTQRYLRKDLRHAREALDRIGEKAGLAPATPVKPAEQSPSSPRKFRIVRIKNPKSA